MFRLLEQVLAGALRLVLRLKAAQIAKQEEVTEPPSLEQQLVMHNFFFGPQGVREKLFNNRMTQAQVDGCERLIRAFRRYRPNGTVQQLAYVLATSYHETGRRMQPVREAFGTSTEDTIRRLDAAWERGQLAWVRAPYWREGWFGRGDVQLTHKANYEGRLAEEVYKRFGIWLVREPDMALDPEISAYIIIEGMFRGDTGVADFTSHALEDYINERIVDYHNARKVVNPGDKSTYAPIAIYAQFFEEALRRAGYE